MKLGQRLATTATGMTHEELLGEKVVDDLLAVDRSAYTSLANLDPVMALLGKRFGLPSPYEFPDGGRTGASKFAGMVLHIISQQISTKVALILYDRLVLLVGGRLSPSTVARLDVEAMRAIGLSRAKVDYLLELAEKVVTGAIDFDHLGELNDEAAIESLTRIRGIGRWSAQMFLIHQLRRPDVFPAGDLALRLAIRDAFGLAEAPTIVEASAYANRWTPYRSYAASLLWRSLPGKSSDLVNA